MKTFYYFVCLCAFSLSAGYAGTVDVTPTSSTREAIPVPGSNTDQLVLHSDSFGNYTVGGGNTATYQSLKAVAGSGDNETPANANFATGTLVIDANAQSGTVTGMSADTFSMNYFNLIVQNTAEDNTATVNIDINKLNVLSESILVTQTQTFSFVGVNAVLNTSNATISNGFEGPQGENTSTLSVDADSKLTWNGNGTFNKYGKLDLKGSMYLNTGKITFNEGSELLADSGASFHMSGVSSIAVAEGATLDFSRGATFKADPGSTFHLYGTMVYTKAITFTKLYTWGTFKQTAGGVTFTRPTEFNDGSNWTVFSRIYLMGNNMSDLTFANVTINDGATLTITKDPENYWTPAAVVFQGNNNLVLNKANAIKDSDGNDVALVTYGETTNNNMTINADQSFTNIHLNYANLDIVMADGVKLTLTGDGNGTTLAFSGDTTLRIYNFAEDTIYVGTSSSTSDLIAQHVELYDANGLLLNTPFVAEDGYISAVPEPAEVAALFGALALAFAAARRRRGIK